ncbi:MAG: hypothetical protein ACE5HR_00270 [bacterium]
MEMVFYGNINFVNEDNEDSEKITCSWDCSAELSFIPPVNSCITLSESSIGQSDPASVIKVETVTLTDEMGIIVEFADVNYHELYDKINTIFDEFKEGWDKWFDHYGGKWSKINVEKPKKEEYRRIEQILREKYKEERKKERDSYNKALMKERMEKDESSK